MFLILIIIYMLCGANIKITFAALILPFLVLHISFLGAGVGLIISSVTGKISRSRRTCKFRNNAVDVSYSDSVSRFADSRKFAPNYAVKSDSADCRGISLRLFGYGLFQSVISVRKHSSNSGDTFYRVDNVQSNRKEFYRYGMIL